MLSHIATWRNRQIIAFPVHSTNHWTLGMVVNIAWDSDGDEGDVFSPVWVGFHFDSYPCNSEAMATAHKLGLQLTGITRRKDLKFTEIPVPGQASRSNDCALWPAHYLKTFLQDIDKFIEYCYVS
jgi:hypothetical protein